ncbi:hypothetical protein [Longitalea luteola]|uniref:hypothetical protein n=1 Tax=Longitalea luteola TaxID=2812563 RepID=UPI001A962022|nr:hypothetical protein [Longitalea luteola]
MVQWIWLVSIWLLVACDHRVKQAAAAATSTDTTLQHAYGLPNTLVDYVTVHFPQWRMVEKNDYSRTWWSFYDSSYNHCWARTDINDDRLADYALLLKKDSLVQLIVFMGTASHSFTHYRPEHPYISYNDKEHGLFHGIAVAPPAQIDVVLPRIQSLILRSNGFALLELEVRTHIYYWQNDRLQTFYMK